jgi:hypothetical protein
MPHRTPVYGTLPEQVTITGRVYLDNRPRYWTGPFCGHPYCLSTWDGLMKKRPYFD